MTGSARRDALNALAGAGGRLHERIVRSGARAVAADVAQGSGERSAGKFAEGQHEKKRRQSKDWRRFSIRGRRTAQGMTVSAIAPVTVRFIHPLDE